MHASHVWVLERVSRQRLYQSCPVCLQEDDVIGVMPAGDKIANLKPLGDRVLIKVGRMGRAWHWQ